MCGLIGASAPKGTKIPRKDITLLYLLSRERGEDSCGFTNISNHCWYTGKPDLFVNIDYYNKHVSNVRNTFLGHTRKKTRGKVTLKNAHPFDVGNIIGTHNGTIYNYKTVAKNLGVVLEDDDVDSLILYRAIDEVGIKKALPEFAGSLGLAYWDTRNESLNLYRFDKPLFYGMKDGILYYASLEKYLKSLGCEEIKEIQEHTLYQIKNGKVVDARNLKKDMSPKTKKEWDTYLKDLEKDKDKGDQQKEDEEKSKEKSEDVELDQSLIVDVKHPNMFDSPAYAKAIFDSKYQYLVLYYFSMASPNRVTLENEVGETNMFNLSDPQDRQAIKKMLPEKHGEIFAEHKELVDSMIERIELTKAYEQ